MGCKARRVLLTALGVTARFTGSLDADPRWEAGLVLKGTLLAESLQIGADLHGGRCARPTDSRH